MGALFQAVPTLMPTRGFDTVSQARKSVETSLDAADTSVRATPAPACEKCGLG